MAEFKCNTCKFYKGGSRCECCFDCGHYEEDKYRWHDLRKNPNDLPKFAPEEYSRDYLCEFKTHYGEIFHEICSYQYFDSVEDFDWCGMGWRERESLIAWREIEPFEVEG